MVIRGGENVYPREIEEFLYTHPDVVDAQVIGVPDERYGEELMAWVRLRAGRRAADRGGAREFCAGKLAHYKIPRYVKIVDEFPMTVTGKIRKVEMRQVSVRGAGPGVGGRRQERLTPGSAMELYLRLGSQNVGKASIALRPARVDRLGGLLRASGRSDGDDERAVVGQRQAHRLPGAGGAQVPADQDVVELPPRGVHGEGRGRGERPQPADPGGLPLLHVQVADHARAVPGCR